jgi:hypothetical protein
VIIIDDGEVPHAMLHEQAEGVLDRVIALERRGGRAKCILNFHGHGDGSHAGLEPAKRASMAGCLRIKLEQALCRPVANRAAIGCKAAE